MTFQQAYAKLNPDQQLAVDTIEGPVMVIAGPGTGKTQILATRIANILQTTDTQPSAILALTFTEAAARNMQQRLISLIGPAAYSVHIQTFHAFCDEVIAAVPEFFPLKQESQVLSDLERFEILEEILRQPRWEALRTINSPFHYLKDIIKTISTLKRESIDPAKLNELVEVEQANFEATKADLKKGELVKQTKRLAKLVELAEIYVMYQASLADRARYDYDDMIALVASGFAEQEELLLQYQEKLQYFLVDEYQDTNSSQNKVVDLLASFWGEQANLFVVGDPNQSIYRFQGASLENTLNFLERYPAAQVIQLKTGYRCTPVIYQAAAQVIRQKKASDAESTTEVINEQPETLSKLAGVLQQLEEPLSSVQKTGPVIEIRPAATPQLENIQVVESVRRLLDAKVPAAEIAVLYRNNAEAADLEVALQKWEIPYITDNGSDALKSLIILQLLTLFEVISKIRRAQEGAELFQVLNFPWLKLPSLEVLAVTRAASKTKMSIYERVKAGYVELVKCDLCEQVSVGEFAVLANFIEKLERWSTQDFELTFPAWFELVMNESGFLDWVLSQSVAIGSIQQLNAIFREVTSLAKQNPKLHLDEFLAALKIMQTHGIKLTVEDYLPNQAAVTLSTTHKAKGQEWAYVFLINCVDGKWGNARQPNELPLPAGILTHQPSADDDRNQDDQRLFYVAISRAKTQIVISYPETSVSGNRAKTTLPSLFIEKIAANLKNYQLQLIEVDDQTKLLAKLLVPANVKNHSETERQWFQNVIADFHLSATALNTYLRSPAEFVEDVLLKVPRAREGYQAFGTAVHFALENLYRAVQEEQKVPQLDFVLSKFEAALAKEILTTEEFELRLAHGQRVLTDYYQQAASTVAKPLFLEKMFGYGWSTTMLNDIPLNGRIDRVDWVDESLKTVKVIDYKTGRARTLNDIEGQVGTEEYSERELALPTNIRGRLKRQLLFYKLLTELDKSFPAMVTEGTFDFVEPDRDGKFTQRHVSLLREDVDALKDLITEVMAEIRALKFLEVT